MMPGPKRRPIGHAARMIISPEMVALYGRMVRIRCTCAPPPITEYWKRELCDNCERWWGLHTELSHLVPHKPWRWPLLAPPSRRPDADGVMRRRRPRERELEL